MSNKQLTPRIRFKGFNDDWEQRKLSKSVNYISSSLKATDANNEGKYVLYNANNAIGFVNTNQIEEKYITIIKDGAGVGRTRILPKNTAFIGTMGAMTEKNSNLEFIFHLLNKINLSKNFSGSTIPHIYFKDYGNELYSIPNLKEQKKIGAIFSQVDNLITLHQRKVDKLLKLKQALLEKMFPLDGEVVPQIRFKGFNNDWEQRKLKDLCILFTDGDWIESKDQSDSGIRLVQTGNVGIAEYLDKQNNQKWISEETFKKLNCEEVLPGDILISRLPEPAGRACIMPSLGMKMITAVDCTIVRTASDCSNKFLIQYLSSQNYFNEVNTALAGGTRQRISRSNLASLNIPIPANHKEQIAIGKCFENLDNLITLHQRKVDKLKKTKQALLEKMFV